MSHYHSHQANDIHSHNQENCCNHKHFHSHVNYKELNKKKHTTLKCIITLTLLFGIIELIGGYYTNSLALISDAFHMITDSSSLILALIMSYISNKPADHKYSYGHGRADTLGAFINGLFMICIIIYIFYEAIFKILHPTPVHAGPMIIIATIGLFVNIASLSILNGHQHSANIKAVLLHVISDLLASLSAIVAGIIIYFYHWNIADPILSILVGLILIPSTINVIKHAMHILMEGVPKHVNYNLIGDEIAKIPDVKEVHDLHIWTMNSENTALSAHIVIEKMEHWNTILKDIQKKLAEQFKITHVTLQPEVKIVTKHIIMKIEHT